MKRAAQSVIASLIKPQPDKAPPPPEGLRCLGCSHCGEMCDRACHKANEERTAAKRRERDR